jgi:hypothetical protein
MGSTKRLLNKALYPDKALLIVALRVLAQNRLTSGSLDSLFLRISRAIRAI